LSRIGGVLGIRNAIICNVNLSDQYKSDRQTNRQRIHIPVVVSVQRRRVQWHS